MIFELHKVNVIVIKKTTSLVVSLKIRKGIFKQMRRNVWERKNMFIQRKRCQ